MPKYMIKHMYLEKLKQIIFLNRWSMTKAQLDTKNFRSCRTSRYDRTTTI
jgi:hypothetical protein